MILPMGRRTVLCAVLLPNLIAAPGAGGNSQAVKVFVRAAVLRSEPAQADRTPMQLKMPGR